MRASIIVKCKLELENIMTKETSKEVATAPAGGGAVAVHDYGADAGAGFEGTTGADLSVPFLGILQSNSPQVEDKDPAGAESGMLFNTVTRELTGGEDGLVFLPCHKELAFVEWVPRDSGGGFVGLHDPNGDVVKKAIEDNDGNRIGKLKVGDNDLIETHYVYGLILDAEGEETYGFAVVSFSSTKIKPYRDWITAMYTLKGKPPMFANRACIRTVKQKNDYGTFYNFRIDPLKETWAKSLIDPAAGTGKALLVEARDFREMVVSGMARAAFETQNATGGDAPAAEGDSPPF